MPDNNTTAHYLLHDPIRGSEVLPEIRALKAQLTNANPDLDPGTITKIINAWHLGGLIDGSGNIWLNARYLPQVIRTVGWIAKRYTMNSKDRDRIELDGETYLRGSRVAYLLTESIMNFRVFSRRDYAEISEGLFHDVRDSSEAKLRQVKFVQQLDATRRKLKRERIKIHRVVNDELTGETLDQRKSEFSHIRAASFYLELSDKVWNGLIVNKETHSLITDRNVADERELLTLCREFGWNRKWAKLYSRDLKSVA